MNIAALYIRRTVKVEPENIPDTANAGFEVLSETLWMFAHLYVAQSDSAGNKF